MSDVALELQCDGDVQQSAQPASPHTHTRGTAGENRMRKRIVGDKDRKITYRLLSRGETDSGSEKQKDKL